MSCVALEALRLAEDVLSRAPLSTQIWPNGVHPASGLEQIRAAIAHEAGKGARLVQSDAAVAELVRTATWALNLGDLDLPEMKALADALHPFRGRQ